MMRSSKTSSYRYVFILICLSSCVHLSHQAGNLSQDITEEDDHNHHHHGHHNDEDRRLDDPGLWLAASAAIVVISLCGVFGIIVIPVTHKTFYQHMVQFLIALAVGTLAGDALLHLIPHAFVASLAHASHEEHEKFHSLSVWMGFIALSSILMFFFFEKMINILGEMRERKVRLSSEKKLRIVRSGHAVSDRAVGERVCKHKYSSYCVSDIDLGEKENRPEPPEAVVIAEENGSAEHPAVKRPLLNKNTSFVPSARTKEAAEESSPAADSTKETDRYETVFIREHEHVHHGHSHAHSHFHSAPASISSVAWMVIFGDGIHNLADGVAIGAAFSESMMSGISTTIAVLCHELPHEIGDFAMLLKAGMTFKQALFYNILSSVLSFLGMVGGVVLGNLGSFGPWIFMATAGIFLYVALVDMIPELNSGHGHPFTKQTQHESRLIEFALQFAGMVTGGGIMLLIALYEHDLKEALI